MFLAVVATPLGLLFAVLLDRKIRGSRIFQSLFFVPVMLSLALVGIIWELMYDRQSGLHQQPASARPARTAGSTGSATRR